MAQGVVVADGDRVVREINPAAARLLGTGPGEWDGIVGRRAADLPAAGPELDGLVNEAAGRDEPVWDRNLTIERDGCRSACGPCAGDQDPGRRAGRVHPPAART